MTDTEQTQVNKWIEHHGYDRCPQCSVEGNLSIAKQDEATAFITLTRQNRALVRLLNSRIVGISG